MPKFLRNLMIIVLLCIALYSPVALYFTIVSVRNISYADAYVRREIKVDSLWVVAQNAGDGAASVDSYHIYSKELDREFSFIDNRGSLLSERIVDSQVIPDLYEYKEQHHDSIQIWYHPKSEIKYARNGETAVPMRDDSIRLVINGILLIIAIYPIRWKILNIYEERKTRKNA